MAKTRPDNPLISIVVPVLDEEGCVEEFARRVAEATAPAEARHEILFVDDGSQDATPEKIAALCEANPAIKSIRFTRSFGHQAALAAGMKYARGDAVVSMDGDLQHPPELLPALLDAWREGADVVHTVREGQDGALKEGLGRAFYRAMMALSAVPVVPAGADFRLMDRRVVDAFNSLDERFVFARGLVPWLGFSETRCEYRAGERYAGRSKFGLFRQMRLALDGIFSFSVVPLRLIALLGLFMTLFGIAFGIFALVAHLTGRVEGSGWTTLVVLILVFGGVQMLSLGIVSEYIGRMYEEVKRRPRYVIDSLRGLD